MYTAKPDSGLSNLLPPGKTDFPPKSFSLIEPQFFAQEKDLRMAIATLSLKATRWPNIGKNAVMQPHALYKGGFSRPMCDLGILSQTAGGDIPLTLQR